MKIDVDGSIAMCVCLYYICMDIEIERKATFGKLKQQQQRTTEYVRQENTKTGFSLHRTRAQFTLQPKLPYIHASRFTVDHITHVDYANDVDENTKNLSMEWNWNMAQFTFITSSSLLFFSRLIL